MNNLRLLNVFGEIDDGYIAEAAPGAKKKANIYRIKWAVAACLCIALAGGILILKTGNIADSPSSDLESKVEADPKLSINPGISGAMGFESYLYYDISELNNGNPWSEAMSISSLPFYKNGAYDPSGAGIPMGLGEEEMLQRLKHAADALGLELLSTTLIGRNANSAAGEAPAEIRGKTDNGTISVQADGSIVYYPSESGSVLPDGYSFTKSSTEEEAKEALSYILQSYGGLLAFREPMSVTWEDHYIQGDLNRRYSAYDAFGDDVEDILNYNLRYASFVPNEKGGLGMIILNDSLLAAEKIGDMPIIPVEEAKALLAAGNYKTSAPAAFPGEEYLEKVELVYLGRKTEDILQPYYRFYVQITDAADAKAEGMKCCGIYYVPAIDDEALR